MATTQYVEGVGRRKTATARVRLTPAKETTVTVNEKSLKDYFQNDTFEATVMSVLNTPDAGIENYAVTVKVSGSGLSAQSEAVRLGIARALVKEKAPRRSIFKPLGFLKRDQRSVERKKFGLRKARRAPQWSKR